MPQFTQPVNRGLRTIFQYRSLLQATTPRSILDEPLPVAIIAMIRKTSICVLGILAGASTGAYVDGFFDRDNVVTNTYQQLVEGSAPTAELAAGLDGKTQGNVDDEQLSDGEVGSDKKDPSNVGSTVSTADSSIAKRSKDELAGKSSPADDDQKTKTPETTNDEAGGSSKKNRLADSNIDKGSKVAADTSTDKDNDSVKSVVESRSSDIEEPKTASEFKICF